MIVARISPGIGNPLLLTMKQFNGITIAMAEQSEQQGPSQDHRANVEAEMRRIHGSR